LSDNQTENWEELRSGAWKISLYLPDTHSVFRDKSLFFNLQTSSTFRHNSCFCCIWFYVFKYDWTVHTHLFADQILCKIQELDIR